MKRFVYLSILLAFFITLCACHTTGGPADNDGASPTGVQSPTVSPTMSAPEEPKYPFLDKDGRMHHRLYINGELVKTQHDPYTYPDKPEGAYYPIEEVLRHLGVECLFDEYLKTLTTKVNGQIITCSEGNKDITVGKYTLGGTAPEYVDSCFYVPSYTFMELLDAVVDFNGDRSGVTLTTGMVIDSKTSGVSGLSISAESAAKTGKKLYSGAEACTVCGGSGSRLCTACSGTGSFSSYSQKRDPVSGNMTVTSTREFCRSCHGSGLTVCPFCGGSGKR